MWYDTKADETNKHAAFITLHNPSELALRLIKKNKQTQTGKNKNEAYYLIKKIATNYTKTKA